jgi:hypothetical protein
MTVGIGNRTAVEMRDGGVGSEAWGAKSISHNHNGNMLVLLVTSDARGTYEPFTARPQFNGQPFVPVIHEDYQDQAAGDLGKVSVWAGRFDQETANVTFTANDSASIERFFMEIVSLTDCYGWKSLNVAAYGNTDPRTLSLYDVLEGSVCFGLYAGESVSGGIAVTETVDGETVTEWYDGRMVSGNSWGTKWLGYFTASSRGDKTFSLDQTTVFTHRFGAVEFYGQVAPGLAIEVPKGFVEENLYLYQGTGVTSDSVTLPRVYGPNLAITVIARCEAAREYIDVHLTPTAGGSDIPLTRKEASEYSTGSADRVEIWEAGGLSADTEYSLDFTLDGSTEVYLYPLIWANAHKNPIRLATAGTVTDDATPGYSQSSRDNEAVVDALVYNHSASSKLLNDMLEITRTTSLVYSSWQMGDGNVRLFEWGTGGVSDDGAYVTFVVQKPVASGHQVRIVG